jgi:hypothetical protein
MKENRIIICRKNSKRIRDYVTRKDAVADYYTICDNLGLNYGSEIYELENGKRVHKGLQTRNQDLSVSLYI